MTDERQIANLQKIGFQVEQLKSLHQECLKQLEQIQGEIRVDVRGAGPSPTKELPHGIGYKLFGQWFRAFTGNDIFVCVLRHFSEFDPTFPELFASRMGSVGRTRSYVAKRIEDLYPGRTDLSHYNKQFATGWYVGTNESNTKKLRMLKIACEVMDIRYGIDLCVRMP